MEVRLHIYDVTNSNSDKTNNTILQIKKFFKDGIGLGGIFHSAIQDLIATVTGWVNRFAHAGDTAVEIAGNTAYRLRQAKTKIVSASKVAYQFLAGVTSNSIAAADSPGNSNRGTPRFQATWFKNFISNGATPSSSSELENQEDRLQQQHAEAPQQQNSQREN